MAIIYDISMIQDSIITWINDITLSEYGHKFVYAGDDIGSNLGEPSKSYMQGQFYYNTDIGVVYLSLVLDPNINWGYIVDGEEMLAKIIEHLHESPRKGLLEDIKIEFVLPQGSLLEKHEARSKCKTEDTNTFLFEDIMYLWKDVRGKYMMLRDNTIHINNRTKLIYNKGISVAKEFFKNFTNEVNTMNANWNRSTTTVDTIFRQYRTKYLEMKVLDNTIQAPQEISESNIHRFYLLNWTDYTIKK